MSNTPPPIHPEASFELGKAAYDQDLHNFILRNVRDAKALDPLVEAIHRELLEADLSGPPEALLAKILQFSSDVFARLSNRQVHAPAPDGRRAPRSPAQPLIPPEQMNDALRQVPAAYQYVLIAHYRDHEPIEKIARSLRISRLQAEALLANATERLMDTDWKLDDVLQEEAG